MSKQKHLEGLRDDVLRHFDEEVEKLVETTGLILERETKEVLAKEGKHATGDAIKSVRSEARKLSWGYVIRTFLGVNYGVFIYEDTKPHWPPLNKIQKWVRLKKLAGRYSVKTKKRLGGKLTQHAEDRQIAWLIARKIARKGTKGIKFFDIALKQAMPMIKKELAKVSR